MTEWQPMETAPKDGTRILAWCLGAYDGPAATAVSWHSTYKVWWQDPNEATEYDPDDMAPSHWMPLPEPPAPTEQCRGMGRVG